MYGFVAVKKYRSTKKGKEANKAAKRAQYHRDPTPFKRRSKKYLDTLKSQLFASLGGAVCKRCGFDDKRALQLDHVYGKGNTQRRILTVVKMIHHAIENPSGYQILCANCNWIKRVENGETR